LRPLVILIASVLVPFLFSPGAAWSEDFDWCGFGADGEKADAYNYGPEIRARFLFVGFPNERNCTPDVVDTLIYGGEHPALLDSMQSWLFSHSNTG